MKKYINLSYNSSTFLCQWRGLLTKSLLLLFFLIFSVQTYAQNKKISGTVKDQSGETIIGASVQVKGASTGTITDLDGRFTLDVPGNGSLIISYMGYKSKEVVLGKADYNNIVLDEDNKLLDEIVVVGYGSMKKSDLTGAVVSANIKDFEKAPNTNLMQSLQGTVPGLNIGQAMQAGETPNISIRGTNTLSGNSSVLIVLDGIIYNGSLASINPADIESVDVLKDASATAVYGAQAANGVLLITSKKGKSGKAKINFSSSYSLQSPTKNIKPMNRSQLLDWDKEVLWSKAYTEESGYTKPNPDFDLASWLPDPYHRDENGNIASTDYNWWDAFTRTGTILENKVSISGGSEEVSYLISLANTTQKNMIKNDDFARNSIRVNLDVQPRKWWKAGIQAFGAFQNKDGAQTYLPYLIQMSPMASPYDQNGDLIAYPMQTAVENPYYGTMVDDYDRSNSFFANLYSEFTLPLKGLTYRINFGNNYNINAHYYASQYAESGKGRAYKNHSTYYDYTLDNILTYDNSFGKHGINATFVYGAVRRKYDYTSADANTFSRMNLGYNSLEQGGTQLTYSDAWKETLLYQMFRLNYKFNDRYLITGTLRRDGFSGFAANNKSSLFPSIALGWIVSEESFFKLPALNYLKLRGGYGVSGNLTSRYASLAKVESEAGYVFGDDATSGDIRQELTSLANPNLKWERTSGINFGFDYGFLKNRISGSFELYQTTTNDLLYNVTIPSITGFKTMTSNVGKLRNKGIEFTISSRNIVTKDFEWTTTFNISSNSNKIISLAGLDADGDGKEDDLTASGLFIGKSISAIYDYKVNGIYQIGDDIPNGFYPGNYRIVDTSGEGEISADDRTILGKTDPDYRFGIMNKFNYKGITLSFFLNSVQGGIGRNSDAVTRSDNAIRYNRFKEQADKFWSPNNPNGIYSRSETAGKITPYLYQKRSFVRLQDVTLSYDLPKSIISKLGIDGLNVYFNCKNLLTFTKWNGWDPEPNVEYEDDYGKHVSGSGYSNRPVMKSFTGGINISF